MTRLCCDFCESSPAIAIDLRFGALRVLRVPYRIGRLLSKPSGPVFQDFDPQITYNKVERRIEIPDTMSDAVVDALENAKALQKKASAVVVRT